MDRTQAEAGSTEEFVTMNRLSHMVFAIALFVGLYTLIYVFSVWQVDASLLSDLLFYYIAGGLATSMISVPILYYKAPHRDRAARTTGNRSSVSALAFVTFCIGSLAGALIYQWITQVPIAGNLSIFIGALIMVTGAVLPDWDITFLGISRHRNIIFHSALLPSIFVLTTVINVATRIVSSVTFSVGASIEYYIASLFLIGYASHLYLDIFPSDASPLEIIWRASNPHDKAPTGIKPLGPINITKKNARGWLVGNATILLIFAIALMALYFYNLPVPSP